MSKKRKGKVNSKVKPKKAVSNPKHPESSSNLLIFDFSYNNWLRSTKINKFTNRLKDESQFANFIFDVLYKLLPTVQKNWGIIKTNQQKQFPHCHTLAKNKIEEVEAIIKVIHGRKLLDEIEDGTLNYWQLGVGQSVRLIAIYNNHKNVMYPLFIDYHHLIHPDVKHNQTDYNNYSFCPYCKYVTKTKAYR